MKNSRITAYDYCRENNLNHILEQWDYTKNKLNPKDYSRGTKKKVWWICSEKHSWEAQVGSRIRYKYGCPVCAGQKIISGLNDFATLHQDAMKEWDQELNRECVDPKTIKNKSPIKAWWKCSKGHKWRASYASRAGGRNCRVCAGKEIIPGVNDLKTQKPTLIPNLISVINPETIFSNDTRFLRWICEKCSKEFNEKPHSLSKYALCKKCRKRTSNGEMEVRNFITHCGIDAEWLSNQRIRKDDQVWEADLLSQDLKIIIEFNGDYWHSDKVFLHNFNQTAKQRHSNKYLFFQKLGYETLFVWGSDWKNNRQQVEVALLQALIDKADIDPMLHQFTKN